MFAFTTQLPLALQKSLFFGSVDTEVKSVQLHGLGGTARLSDTCQGHGEAGLGDTVAHASLFFNGTCQPSRFHLNVTPVRWWRIPSSVALRGRDGVWLRLKRFISF